MGLELDLYRFARHSAEEEILGGYPRLRALPSLAASSLLQTLSRLPVEEASSVVFTMVRSAHREAAAQAGEPFAQSDWQTLKRLHDEQFSALTIEVGRGLSGPLFRDLVLRALSGRERERSKDGNLVMLTSRQASWRVVTWISTTPRPYYFQSLIDDCGETLIERQSYLRLLGVADVTILDQASEGDEASVGGLIAQFIGEFEDWCWAAGEARHRTV